MTDLMRIQEHPIELQQTMITSASSRPVDAAVVRLEPARGWIPLKLGDLWAYRELLYFLIWRDISVRYKQTFLGALWAIIQPVFTMVVFTLIFGRLARMPSDNIPYPIFSYAALVPWTFFANGLNQAASSVVRDANLITKVYFPRLVLPTAAVMGGIVDFMLAFAVLIAMMVGYGIVPTANVFWVPAFALLAMATALSVGIWLAALNVWFRDVRHVVPFLIQIWLYATPVVYPSSLIPDRWRLLYVLNPMAGVVQGFRWALLGSHSRPGPIVGVSLVVDVALLIGGAFFFRRMERTFADVV